MGAGSVGSNTGPGKVDAGTAVSNSTAVDNAQGAAALEGGMNRRSGVMIDVTSRPTSGTDDDEDDEDDDDG